METKISPVTAIDFRLSHCKEELDRIYAQQDELLSQIHHELKEDFCMTRAARIKEIAETERQNLWLLSQWTS